jgi:zinc transport system permease protein
MLSAIISYITTEANVFDIFDYSFMIRAMVAGVLVAAAVPLLGIFLVARRYSLIADSLAHVSLAGVGLGLVLGLTPIYVAVPVTAIGAILLEWLRQKQKLSGEISLAILMSGGLAVAIVLAHLARGVRVDFNSYLFGSITTTSATDIIVLALTVLLIIGLVLSQYRAFMHMSFDEDSARIAGYNVEFLNYALAVMAAVLVVLSLRIIGGLLMSALLVIPVVTAGQWTRSFNATVVVAVIFALAAVLVGLVVAFYAGIAAGGAIVLASLTLLVLSMLLKP